MKFIDPFKSGGLACALLLAGCTVDSKPAQVQTAEISQFTQSGFASVNSWLIETNDGIVLIDSQRVLSIGNEVADTIKKTGKPLLAIIITHPHPDHFGGLAEVKKAYPEAPVYASRATIEVMKTDSNGYQAATRAVVPDDSPETFPIPTEEFEDGDVLRFGSLELMVDEIGAGEAETMTMLYAANENSLFVTDLVANKMTGFLLEGRSGEWLDQIELVREQYGTKKPTIYPGHGVKGSFDELLSDQASWLQAVRRLVSDALNDGTLSETEVGQIESELGELFPNYPMVAEIPTLLSLNIKAVAEELRSEAE